MPDTGQSFIQARALATAKSGVFAFVGATYTSRSRVADCERSINLFPEIVESGAGKAPVVLYSAPGYSALQQKLVSGAWQPADLGNPATLDMNHVALGANADRPVRCLFAVGGGLFAVSGGSFFQLFDTPIGVFPTFLGKVGRFANNAQIFANGQGQAGSDTGSLFIVSGQTGYIYDGTSLTAQVPAVQGGYCDGYFIAVRPNSQQFNISQLYDVPIGPVAPIQPGDTLFDALDYAIVEGLPDKIIAMVVDHREIWFFGSNHTEIFQNTGGSAANNYFPFERIQGAYLEVGILAPDSLKQLDNSIFWITGDARGFGTVVRANGYTPVRVSNHAVEAAMQANPSLAQAKAYSYQDGGHTLYCLNIPGSQTTWCYDVATNMWHERARWDQTHGNYVPAPPACHAYAFGKHLVGDSATGKIYDMSMAYDTDDGHPIRWERTAPHIASEMKRQFYSGLWIDMETGRGATNDFSAIPPVMGQDPQVMMQTSNDGGRTFGREYWASAGKTGDYLARAHWHRLGSARDRVFRAAGTFRTCLTGAYLDVTPGYE